MTHEQQKLTKDLWNWVPHPSQAEFLGATDSKGRPPRLITALCGRRWGKTEAIAVDCAIRLLTEPTLGQVIVSASESQAKLLFDTAASFLRLPETLEYLGETGAVKILKNGENRLPFTILAEPHPQIIRTTDRAVLLSAFGTGADGRHLRGRGTERRLPDFRIVVDERGFVPDNVVENVLKPMLATAPGGGQLVQVGTPWQSGGAFRRDFERGLGDPTGQAISFHFPSHANPLVSRDYLAEMEASMDAHTFAQEFLAVWQPDGGITNSVASEAEVAKATVSARPASANPTSARLGGFRYVAGIDWGRKRSETAVAVLAIGGARSEYPLHLVELWHTTGRTWTRLIDECAEILQKWGVRMVLCDSTGVGDPASEQLQADLRARRVACPVDGVIFTQNSRAFLIDDLSIAISRGLLTFPAEPELLRQLRTGPRRKEGDNRHQSESLHDNQRDDLLFALGLAVHAALPYLGSRARSTTKSEPATTTNDDDDRQIDNRESDPEWQRQQQRRTDFDSFYSALYRIESSPAKRAR